jgi:hypothetical protein
MEKINEQLELPIEPDYEVIRRQLITSWREMAILINNLVTLYYQDEMPTIPTNTSSLWVDTDGSPNYYIIANFGGTMKKVELT